MIHKNKYEESLSTIVDKVLHADKAFFEQYDIDVIHKSGYHILNYSQIAKPNDLNKITRGMVIRDNGEVICFPFVRFFNVGEIYAEQIDFHHASVIEKLDGTLLCVSFDTAGKLIFNTRRMISEHIEDRTIHHTNFDGQELNFLNTFKDYIDRLILDSTQHDFTLMFEAVITNRPVITVYDNSALGLYLIGARNKKTLEELQEHELDILAKKIGAMRPRIFDAVTNFEQINKMMGLFNEDYEGFVIRDNITGNRIKVKQESYIMRHRLIGMLNVKNLLYLYIDGERSEIESYFPNAKTLFDDIGTRINQLVLDITSAFNLLRDMTNRKDYAICVMNNYRHISTFLFRMFGNDIEDIYTFVCSILKTITIKQALTILNYSSDE